MNFRELNINLFKNEIIKETDKLVDLRNNISSNYILAKNDFITIDNYRDCIDTYGEIVSMLESLQDRIIKRNQRR